MGFVFKRLVRFTVAATIMPLPVLAAEIHVPLDNVMIMTLDQPAKTVYVANPAIADITVVDPRHIFILGKSFGTTNLVTLDGSGRETLNQQLIVTEREGRPVTVQRGTTHSNMICTQVDCELATAPGDAAPAASGQGSMAPGTGGDGLTANAGGIGSAIGSSLGGK